MPNQSKEASRRRQLLRGGTRDHGVSTVEHSSVVELIDSITDVEAEDGVRKDPYLSGLAKT